ncbi:hypothetical protein EW146_g8397 [Bondarzewia mesenterica]|uniref:Uncharacterized protein n=1 Tax=Bondarzewia mesenterica TaxID=1095465 RepID=A0A4S4LEX9_9AGAM|nr:hypothetical protein EW146_g8397 [Bondarzewia mesenterica]
MPSSLTVSNPENTDILPAPRPPHPRRIIRPPPRPDEPIWASAVTRIAIGSLESSASAADNVETAFIEGNVTDSPSHATVDMREFASDVDLRVDGRTTTFCSRYLAYANNRHVVHPAHLNIDDDSYIYGHSSCPTDHPELDANAVEGWPSLATMPKGITVTGDVENTSSMNQSEQSTNHIMRAIPDIINTIRRMRGMEPLSHEAQEDMATLDAGADNIAASGGAVNAGDLAIPPSNHASDALSIESRPTEVLDSRVELEEDNVYGSMQVSPSCNVSQSHSFLTRDVDMNNHTSVNPPAPSTVLLHALAQEALYFVGIDLSSYNGRQNTVCEMGPEYSPALTVTDVLQRLMERGGLLSRTLLAVRQDMNIYGQLLLGSADIPMDIVDNYMHYSCNFHEISLWSSQGAGANSHHLEVSPPSPQRTRLIAQRRLPDTTNVFIVYCYLQDTIPLRIMTHPPLSISPTAHAASLDEHHIMPPATHESWSSTTAEDGIIQRGQLRGLRVEPTHVAAWAGVPLSTFAGLRTQWTRARDALIRLHSAVDADITLSTEQMLTLRILEAMLGDTILPPAGPNYLGTAAEMEAVRIRTGRVDDLVAAIRQDIVLHVQ